MRKEQLVKVGVVGVDSGQVIICDPCYIGSEWRIAPVDESVVPSRVYKDKKTGKTYAFKGDVGAGIKVDVKFDNYDSPLKDYKGKTPNKVRKAGLWKAVEPDPKHDKRGEFSYPGVCHTTLTPAGFGQLMYKMGHAGAGIASRTMCGDGCFPVFAEVDNEGAVKRLIIDFQVCDYKNDIQAAEYEQIRKDGYSN